MILVTGSGGVLGRALADTLAQGTEDYRLLSSADVDLRDRDATRALFQAVQPRLIFHLAGRVHGLMGNQRFPAEMFVDNIRINTNVIDAAHLSGCQKIVAVGTVATYSSGAPMPVQESAIWNGPPHRSEAAYGHAKRAMLAQLEAYADQYGSSYAYAIMTNIYGPHDRFDAEHGHVVPSLIAKFYEAARKGSAVNVWGTGVAERDFIMSRDAARALIMIADAFEGPINVATGEIVSIRDLVDALREHTGVPDVQWDQTKPDGQIKRRYDVAKLFGLGFKPSMSAFAGVAETYDWYVDHYPNVRR